MVRGRPKNVSAIIQARMGSARLPGKVMMDLHGKTVLARVIERVKAAKTITSICVATSKNAIDNAVLEEAKKNNVACFRGSEEDVLDRYNKAAAKLKSDIVVRVTADNPLTEPSFVDLCVDEVANKGYDFAAMKNVPYGSGAEVMRRSVLIKISKIAKKASDREHVTSYLYKNTAGFKMVLIEPKTTLKRPDVRVTLDTAEDYLVLCRLFSRFSDAVSGRIGLKSAIDFLDKLCKNETRHL